MSCLVCGKETEQAKAGLCRTHVRALDSVGQAFEAWAKAYGCLSLSDFLKRVAKLTGTGHSPGKWK